MLSSLLVSAFVPVSVVVLLLFYSMWELAEAGVEAQAEWDDGQGVVRVEVAELWLRTPLMYDGMVCIWQALQTVHGRRILEIMFPVRAGEGSSLTHCKNTRNTRLCCGSVQETVLPDRDKTVFRCLSPFEIETHISLEQSV